MFVNGSIRCPWITVVVHAYIGNILKYIMRYVHNGQSDFSMHIMEEFLLNNIAKLSHLDKKW